MSVQHITFSIQKSRKAANVHISEEEFLAFLFKKKQQIINHQSYLYLFSSHANLTYPGSDSESVLYSDCSHFKDFLVFRQRTTFHPVHDVNHRAPALDLTRDSLLVLILPSPPVFSLLSVMYLSPGIYCPENTTRVFSLADKKNFSTDSNVCGSFFLLEEHFHGFVLSLYLDSSRQLPEV